MREGWLDFELAEICRPRQWPTIAQHEMLRSGYPVFGANGQIGFFSSYNHEKPTVVVTCRGASCGQVLLTPSYCYITGNAMALDNLAEGKIIPRFLVEILRFRGFEECVTGSAQPQIIGAEIGRVRIKLPPLPEQWKIAEILDTIDDAIRKTKQLTAKLERVKQGLLHDLLTRGINDNGELRDPERHPEQFKDSVLGWIPKVWKVEMLGDLSATFSGSTPLRSQESFFGGPIPWVKSAEVNAEAIEETEESLTPLGFRSCSARWVEPGTPVIALYGATAGAVSWLKIGATTNQAVLAIPPLPDTVESRWLYWALLQYSSKLLRNVQGSGQPNLSKRLVDEVLLAVPGETAERGKIVQILDSISQQLTRDAMCIGKLNLLKQGLMEDLLTGRVRVTPLLETKP